MQLRHFLYRDDALVREFIAQIEGGIFDEAEEKTHEGGNSGVGGGMSAGPVSGKASRSRERSREETRKIRQTGASEFERFHRALGDDLQYLEAADDEIWQQLRRGEPLEVEAVVRPAGLGKVAEALNAFEGLAPLFEMAGSDAFDSDTTKAIAGFRSLAASTSDKLTIIARLAGTPRFTFACILKTDSLFVPVEELDGEATIVGKIQRKLREGETYLLPSVFGGLEAMLPEHEKTQFAELFDDEAAQQLGLTNPMLKHPSALLTPIAIFR